MKQKTFFGLYATVIGDPYYGTLYPCKLETLIFRGKNINYTLPYESFQTGHIKTRAVPKLGSGRFGQRAEPTYLDHFVYLVAACWNLPRILNKDACLFITPPFFNCLIIPFLKLSKKDIYIVVMDSQVDLAFTYKPGPFKRLLLLLADKQEKWAIRNATKIFPVSKYLEEKYRKLNPNVFLVPNGADIEYIQDKEGLRLFDEFTVTYMGGFENYRGIDMLIEAFNKASEGRTMKLLIIGDGPEKKNLLHKAKGSKDIKFTGYVPHEKAIEYLKGSDVLVMPSRESLQSKTISSIKCFEYIACEVPSIVTDTGDHAFWIRRCEAGIVVKDEPDQIQSAIKRLYDNENLRQEYAQNCKKNKHLVDFKKFKDVFKREVLK